MYVIPAADLCRFRAAQHNRRWFAVAILSLLGSLVIVPLPWPAGAAATAGGGARGRTAAAKEEEPLLAGSGGDGGGGRRIAGPGEVVGSKPLPPLPELTSPQVLRGQARHASLQNAGWKG